MNWLKKVLAVCSFCTLLTTTNCLAVTQENTDITDDKLNCYKTYLVQEDEKDTFIDTLDKDIEVFGEKYTFDSYTSEGGTTTDTIDISTTKKITSDTNNLNSIINQLGRTIHYEKDGYIGEYQLNTENIQIKTNYNGFREDLIEETINYTGLERNDLDFIPKQTEKDGLTLLLADVRNPGNKDNGDFGVDIKLVDKEGNELATIGGYIDSVKVGETVTLNITVTSSLANSYDFEVKKAE